MKYYIHPPPCNELQLFGVKDLMPFKPLKNKFMKKVFIPSLVTFLFLLSITSCKKDKTTPEVKPVEVTGKWRWIYTYIDVPLSATNPLTPANTGTTEGMEYTASNLWRKFYNGIVIDSGTFALEHNTHTNPSGTLYNYDQISYNRNNSYLGSDYYRIMGDTLVFDPGVAEYWTSLNVRYVGGTKWFVKQ